jgi:methyl-accepting chemotaxis protein
LNIGLSEPADIRHVTRFSFETDRPAYLVASIMAFANQTTTLAVDSAVEAVRAADSGDLRVVAEQVSRLAVGAAVATGEITWRALELDQTSADDDEIASAGIAVTGLQASLLAIAGVVQAVAENGGPGEAYASAETLRNAALTLDELLPSYQPL